MAQNDSMFDQNSRTGLHGQKSKQQFFWRRLYKTHAYLKLKLLDHLHLYSTLCGTSVIQSVITAEVPDTHTHRGVKGTLL